MAKAKKYSEDLPEEEDLLRYWWKLAKEEDGIARIQALKEYQKLKRELGATKAKSVKVVISTIEQFKMDDDGNTIAIEATPDDKIKKISAAG
jgi:hypothetical protein